MTVGIEIVKSAKQHHQATIQGVLDMVVDGTIKYIRDGNVSGSFSEGCDCESCDIFEKKVRKEILSTLQAIKETDV